MPSLTIFCGLRKVRFQCYCAQFKFNRIFLVLTLLSTTFYIIVETLAQIPFVEASLWRFKKLFRRPFLAVFCSLRKVRFDCYSAHFNFKRIVLVLKLFLMTFYIMVKTLAQIPFVEASICMFRKLVRRQFLTVFCSLRKVRFQCYCAQFNFNRIFLVLKLLSTTFYIIVKTLVQIPFLESSLWRIQMLVRRPFLTVFADYAKYISNATVGSSSSIEFFLCSNYFQRPFISSLKLWLRYLAQNPRYGGLKNWFEDLFSQFFADYAKYVSNATVLSSTSIEFFLCSNYFQRPFISSLKLWIRYLLQNPRYGGFKCWFEGLLSQFFADYAKYVSNASVLSSTSIGLFFCSNYFQ